ncbi:hypothetical protein G4V62_00235 [Bacillaceae bacterium SIJ1]|uniref:YrhC family protein n=1 Tax=Litoribacterium kuwaitense TaxID=1398745 RepID=UPI0013EAE3A8|nr:YrhC family protein [Litoribacterium kuwaitense]NGP43468.1 hypothetical protein [Litoribacterium kuwaitense]
MESKQAKTLEAIKLDYKHYGMTLLAVAVFMYLGVWVPTASSFELWWMIGTMVALTGSFFSFRRSVKAQKALDQQNEENVD